MNEAVCFWVQHFTRSIRRAACTCDQEEKFKCNQNRSTFMFLGLHRGYIELAITRSFVHPKQPAQHIISSILENYT